MRTNKSPDIVGRQFRDSTYDGSVFFLHFAAFELAADFLMNLIVFGNQNYTGRIAIQTMYDAGSMTAGDIAERIEVKLQRTRQRALGVASPRMHDHIRLLVDHDDCVIFVQDIQRQILRDDVRFLGVRQLNPDSIIHPQTPR